MAIALVGLAAMALPSGTLAAPLQTGETPLDAEPVFSAKCLVGPATIEIAGHIWLAFACDDGKSVAIATGDQHPAAPYVFIIAALDDHYAIRGQGDGNVELAHAAGREIQSWDAARVQQVHDDAMTAGG